MHESIVEQTHWVYGEKYLVLDRSLRHVAEALARGLDVRLNWQVEEVDHSEGGGRAGVTVRGAGGDTVEAQRCIVAAPVTALKPATPCSIRFRPALPQFKQRAVDTVRVANAVKVFLAFERPFWPEGLFDVACVGCFLPELWILSYPPEPPTGPAGAGLFDPQVAARTKEVVTFFAAGNLADELSKMSKDEIVGKALDQLDQMFGSEADPAPSRTHLTGSHVADWSTERLVGGAYTYPTLRSSGNRGVMAAPLGDRVFFAGEATHLGVNPCMQGAMETGIRAASQVLACVKGPERSRM